jgi:hypothetical protein
VPLRTGVVPRRTEPVSAPEGGRAISGYRKGPTCVRRKAPLCWQIS